MKKSKLDNDITKSMDCDIVFITEDNTQITLKDNNEQYIAGIKYKFFLDKKKDAVETFYNITPKECKKLLKVTEGVLAYIEKMDVFFGKK